MEIKVIKEQPTAAEAETNLSKPKVKITGIAFTNIIFAKIFKQLSTFVLLVVSLLTTLIFTILFLTAKNEGQILVYFDYFFVVFMSFIIFVSVMKITQTLWKTQFEDKSIVIYQAQSISRAKLFFAMYMSSLLLIYTVILLNLLTMVLVFSLIKFTLNFVFIKFWLTMLIYSLIASFCLISFCTFVNVMFSQSFSLILFTFILAATFICSLPYQFYKESVKNLNITVTDGEGYFPNSINTAFKVEDIENYLNFQKYVRSGRIRYPHLSKWLNTYYIDGDYTVDKFDKESSSCSPSLQPGSIGTCPLEERQLMWRDLGMLNTTTSTSSMKDVTLANVPTNDNSWGADYPQKKDVVSFEFEFTNFVSYTQLLGLVDDARMRGDEEKALVLNDFANYYTDLLVYYEADAKNDEYPDESSFSKGENRMLYAAGSKFGPLLDFKSGKVIKSGGEEFELQKSHFISLVVSANDSKQTLRVEKIGSASQKFQNFLTDSYEPVYLAARILETYFINQTSNFTYLNNLTVPTNNSVWKDYSKKTFSNRLISNFNFLENFLQFFTFNRGFSYNDFWFTPGSNSNISFDGQKNLFLSYDEPQIFLKQLPSENMQIDFDKWENYKSNRYLFVAGYAITCFILTTITAHIFKRMDIN
ncbi:ABC transporter permease [Spiroplasma sabaudiense Ar-1343]|uniref:ABC transporter permease n=1 Tax=Spiroplasma sabaudiense Ar-1343 TaxID=1276257 RepID=W6AAM6_9MOLU|nr:ABC transporter permease [Spiroplasma sabaudiense]AHI54112.1 ABC transporter permease [Spiroplasma sabaudiense Ar-1343]